MALPSEKNISLYQGDTFELLFRLKSGTSYVDLTGATPTAQIRASADAASPIISFTAALTDQTATPGGVMLTLSAAQTSGLTANGVWDVQLAYPDGSVKTYLKGTVTVVKEVTRGP